jgi:hypothetical protein
MAEDIQFENPYNGLTIGTYIFWFATASIVNKFTTVGLTTYFLRAFTTLVNLLMIIFNNELPKMNRLIILSAFIELSPLSQFMENLRYMGVVLKTCSFCLGLGIIMIRPNMPWGELALVIGSVSLASKLPDELTVIGMIDSFVGRQERER